MQNIIELNKEETNLISGGGSETKNEFFDPNDCSNPQKFPAGEGPCADTDSYRCITSKEYEKEKAKYNWYVIAIISAATSIAGSIIAFTARIIHLRYMEKKML